RLPPTPPLVPYTTLFRSSWRDQFQQLRQFFVSDGVIHHLALPTSAHHAVAPQYTELMRDRRAIHSGSSGDVCNAEFAVKQRDKEDRKSTRLNSSHVSISY